MWGTSTDVFVVLKTRIYPSLVFDLAYSHSRTKRASNFCFVACSTNKLTKTRHFSSHMEQYRKLSSFWVRVRTKNPTSKKPQQLGIKAGAGMERRGMTVHSHRGKMTTAHRKAHNGRERMQWDFMLAYVIVVAYMPTVSICAFVFIYYFPATKGF